MIYFVLVDYFSLSVYFGVAKVTAKIVQMSEMKKKYAVFFFISECSLSYEKIVQMSEMKKKYAVFFFISECSLSYEKIVQASGMTKQNTQFLFFIPERRISYEKI